RHSSQPRNAWAASGMAGAPRLAGMAKPPPSAYLGAMRRWADILTLIVIWAASMAALALGLDGLLGHPPFVPYALISGAYFGALSTVSLAEEISEWRAARDYRPNCPLERRGSGGWGRVFRRCSEAVAQRQLPGS